MSKISLQDFHSSVGLFQHIFKPMSSIRAGTVIICLLINCPTPSVTLSMFEIVEKSIQIHQISAKLDFIHNINLIFFFFFLFFFYILFNQFSIHHAKATVIFSTHLMSFSYTKVTLFSSRERMAVYTKLTSFFRHKELALSPGLAHGASGTLAFRGI